MTTKIYIAAAAAFLIILAVIAAGLWSDRRLAKIERQLAESEQAAAIAERRSRELELAAAEYKRKIDHLEGSLSALGRIAAKQDEDLKLLETETVAARRGVDRARAVRRIEITAAELCRKLAETGHPCE